MPECGLICNNINSLSLYYLNNTLDWSPVPFLAENIGNINVDVNLTSTQLFTAGSFPGSNFQYRIGENETSSYTSALDSGWTDLNTTTGQTSVTGLKWQDANDAFNVHILILVHNRFWLLED